MNINAYGAHAGDQPLEPLKMALLHKCGQQHLVGSLDE